MAVIKCQDITGIECLVVFDADEDFVIGQMIAHAKGTHQIAVSEAQIRDFWNQPVKEVKEEVEKEAEADYSDLNYRDLLKLAKNMGVWKRGMRKADLLEALS